MDVVPKQLQKDGYRFCLLRPKLKIPFEDAWQKRGYVYNDPKLLNHLQDGGNYGVIGGYGNLRILDIDDKELAIKVMGELKTFTIKTCGGGFHFYFLSDYDKNHVFVNEIGELRANNYMVVGPNCYAVDKKKGHEGFYRIARNTEIINVSKDSLTLIIKLFLREEGDNNTTKVQSGIKDTSRSARDYREVIKLVKAKKSKEDIFNDMMAFAKWSESTPAYREHTYKKALAWVDKQEEEKEKKKRDEFNFDEASEAFRRLTQAKTFTKKQPLFYDNAGIWWLWNFDKFCYERSDDIDILNGIASNMNIETTNSKVKNEILSALKQVGRKSIAKEPEKTWVQFKDKIVDVLTGEQFESTPEYFITNPIPWSVGETEDTPTMDKYFGEWVVMDKVQDKSYIRSLYEHIAYSTLQHQFLQRIFAYTGSGSNGKGVFLSLIQKFLGKDNVCTTELKILATKQFESSSLYKKQAVFMTEVDAYDMQNTNLLKKLTGEDDIRYEFKGKTAFKEASSTTSFISTNSLPVTPDKSIAFYRRWDIIDFPHTFTVGKDILAEIPDIEFNNLAKKCIRICKELYEIRKFNNEGSVQQRMKRYEERSNPLMEFVETKMDESPEAYIIFNTFHKLFCEFLNKKRLRPMTKRTVTKALRDEGFQVKGRRTENKSGEEIQTTCVFCIQEIAIAY